MRASRLESGKSRPRVHKRVCISSFAPATHSLLRFMASRGPQAHRMVSLHPTAKASPRVSTAIPVKEQNTRVNFGYGRFPKFMTCRPAATIQPKFFTQINCQRKLDRTGPNPSPIEAHTGRWICTSVPKPRTVPQRDLDVGSISKREQHRDASGVNLAGSVSIGGYPVSRIRGGRLPQQLVLDLTHWAQ